MKYNSIKPRSAIVLWTYIMGIMLCVVSGCKKDPNHVDNDPKTEVPGENEEEDTDLFTHPGILSGQSRLQEISFEDDEYRLASYGKLEDFLASETPSSDYEAVVIINVENITPSYDKMRRDATIAYGYAVRWTKWGIPADALQARRILDGWAGTFQRFEGEAGTTDTEVQIEASRIAAVFTAAAEIIHYYKVNGSGSGWSNDNTTKFKTFLSNLSDNYISKLSEDVNNGMYYDDWGASAAYAQMSIGVFLNDKDLYDEGRDLTLKLIPLVIESDGKIPLLCAQGCMRSQFALGTFTYASEIARLQGDNELYEFQDRLLQKGWEWLSNAFTEPSACVDCQAAPVMPFIEVAYSYYKPAGFSKMRMKTWPYGNEALYSFIGFTSYTHFDYERVLVPGDWKGGSQSWVYDFGSGTGTGQINGDALSGTGIISVSTPSTQGWFPSPLSGSARVFLGSKNEGSFRLVDPGSGPALEITGTNASLNKFSLYNIAEGSPIASCIFKVKINGTASGNANWRLGIGNREALDNVFSNGSSIPNTTNTDLFAALQWMPAGTDNNLAFSYKQAHTTFAQINNTTFARGDTEYLVEIYCNNSSTEQVYVRGEMEFKVPPRNYHIWVDGNKLRRASNNIDHFPGATPTTPTSSLQVGKAINSFMLTSNQVNNPETFTISNIQFRFK